MTERVMPLKLEVGKTYRTRLGDKVFIDGKDESGWFLGKHRGSQRSWDANGVWSTLGSETNLDLIEEATLPADAPPITAEEIHQWGIGAFGNHALEWFADVLNGTYSVAEAREDCLSIVRPKPMTAVEAVHG